MRVLHSPFRTVPILVALVIVLGAGCVSEPASTCTVVENDDGSATISCDDGTEAVVRDGTDGSSCTVTTADDGTRTITCADGTTVTVADGVDGIDGVDGTNGADGVDGADGLDGVDGTDSYEMAGGLQLEILEATIDTARHPTMVLRFSDVNGTVLIREGLLGEGAIVASFTAAHLPIETRGTVSAPVEVVLPYVNYKTRTVTSADGARTAEQPTADTTGTWTALPDGSYRYTYALTLPMDYPVTETHTLGVYAERTVAGITYVDDGVSSFRPDGMAIVHTSPSVTTSACNTCHEPLSAHGPAHAGKRESVELCVTCHGGGYADPDTGNRIEFRELIHKIHRGASLPSVQAGGTYGIIGFRGALHDFSEVQFPQDIRNCQVCHDGPDADRWMESPSRVACGSCHDDIWWEAGAPPTGKRLHPGDTRPTDAECVVCHSSGATISPVDDWHWTKYQAPTALDPSLVIDSVAIDSARKIVVDFTVTVNGTPRDILASPLVRHAFHVAGPTTDYAFAKTYRVGTDGTLAAIDAAAGRFRWTSSVTVEAIATAAGVEPEGTWAVAAEGMAQTPAGVQYAFDNPVAYLALTDAAPVARRTVVDEASCATCHERLERHGGPRNDPELCVMCHNPNGDDLAFRPDPALGTTDTTAPISFARLVHRVHRGAEASSPYVVYGFGGAAHSFDATFPGDLRVCETCHVSPASRDLPLPDAQPVRSRIIDDTGTVVGALHLGATAAACGGCHDGEAASAHADTMTSALGAEACAACHATGSSFGVDVVHRRPNYDPL